jgi:hypothetical protein
MFSRFTFFTKKTTKPTPTAQKNFEELVALQLRASVSIDSTTRANIKKRLLNQIKAQKEDARFEKRMQPRRFRLPSLLTFATFQKTVASLILLLVVGGISFTVSLYRDSAAETKVAWVSAESGVVRILPAGGEFFREITGEVAVRLGDTIRVGKDSAASLRFWDASKMRLTPETEVAITSFELDNLQNEKSAVRVALLSGSVDTVVNREKTSPAFEIATPSGNVAAKKAKFSVSLDKQTGKVAVATSESSVAVTSSSPTSVTNETVALVAGQTAVFSDDKVLVAATDEDSESAVAFIPPAFSKVLTATDFVQIHFFDALSAAQKGDTWIAKQIEAGIEEDLAGILKEFGVTKTANQITALITLLEKNYAENPKLPALIANLNRANSVAQILNYYFIQPSLLRGIPEFELLAKSNYQPPAELQNIFALLKAKQLASRAIQPTVTTLTSELLSELALSADFTKLVGEMNQPVYLFALRELTLLVAVEKQALVATRITELEAQIEKYIGS